MNSIEPKRSILIVDDELVIRDSLQRLLEDEGYEVTAFSSGRQALETFRPEQFQLALLDIRMPGMDGMELQKQLHDLDPDLMVIIMTGYAAVDTAVQALKQGAYDYLVKPVDPDDLLHLVSKAIDHRVARHEVARLRESIEQMMPSGGIIGRSAEIQRVRELVQTVAETDATVLITGESGTGKEVVARAIHHQSPRRNMPMITIHCGALTESLLESELFGHERGAFTGAQFKRKGKFELADGGTAFLDEIGDISLKSQTDLLRVLQEKEIVRVGGSQTIKVNFRCIAATNKNLEKMVKAGTFRFDLFYRLNVFAIELPPLRDRREDIPLLVDHFLRKFCEAINRTIPRVDPAAMEMLMGHDWPGNVRELENAVERALVIGRDGEIGTNHFALGLAIDGGASGRTLEEIERIHIERTVRECGGNISQASRVLDIDRTTLYAKLKRYQLTR